MTKLYELIVLLPAKQSDASLKKSISAIKKELEGQGAKITEEESWGKRTMTYDIAKQSEAYYHIINMELDGAKIDELKKEFNLNGEILRYMFTALPENYQKKEGQHIVEIVEDVINFGESNTKPVSSNPIANPDARRPKITKDSKEDSKEEK